MIAMVDPVLCNSIICSRILYNSFDYELQKNSPFAIIESLNQDPTYGIDLHIYPVCIAIAALAAVHNYDLTTLSCLAFEYKMHDVHDIVFFFQGLKGIWLLPFCLIWPITGKCVIIIIIVVRLLHVLVIILSWVYV